MAIVPLAFSLLENMENEGHSKYFSSKEGMFPEDTVGDDTQNLPDPEFGEGEKY